MVHGPSYIYMVFIYRKDVLYIENVVYVSRGFYIHIEILDVSLYRIEFRLSIKIPSYQYRNSHFHDKTVTQPPYIYSGTPYT